MRLLSITLAAAAVAATVSLACGQDQEAVPPDATAAPTAVPASPAPAVKGQLWRWVNVTVVVPEGSDILVIPSFALPEQKPPGGGPALELRRDMDPNDTAWSWVLIDAEGGAILKQELLPGDEATIEAVVATLDIFPLDRATAAWPHNGDPSPDLVRANWGGISFLRPDPSTGLSVLTAINDPGGYGVSLWNGRSSLGIYLDPVNGQPIHNTEHLLPDDREVFERWAATIKVCAGETPC